ncbi:MAG: GNAT family N-acetyltransferase [Magnetococcales bacterium]|nr:GNAT family N-acetyltransferase [Magnetococcales bacterium]
MKREAIHDRGTDPLCTIQPLTPAWQAEAKRVYDRAFAGADLPYGRSLPDNFLANRVFGSCLWSADCSRLLVTPAGEGVGLVIANRRANPASGASAWLWLQLLCIVPGWHRQGWGRMLLHSLLDTVRTEGQQGVATALQWAGVWPGIADGLKGMQKFCAHTGAALRPGEWYLAKSLHTEEPWQGVGGEASTDLGGDPCILPYQSRHQEGLYRLLRDHFSIGWQHETLSRIDPGFEPFNGYGLAATLDPHQPGQGVLVVECHGQVVGFCVVQAEPDGPTAFFGPIGLVPAWRGQGWGSRLLVAAACQARQWGRQTLGLWTSAALADGFYAPLGFRRVVTTQHAVWRAATGANNLN